MSVRLGYKVRQRKFRSLRAGLLFPVGRIHRHRKDMPGLSRNIEILISLSSSFSIRMGKFAPVYLTAVLEYLTAEVLEQAGLISKLLKLDRVTPQSIRLAIREDKGEIVF